MKKIMTGFAFCLCFILCATLAHAAYCPVDVPCTCDNATEVIHCEEPSLTIAHITFDDIPPFAQSDVHWKLLNLSHNFIHAIHKDPFHEIAGIEVIDLSFNRIDDIDHDGFNGVADGIQELDLSYNRITQFPTNPLFRMSNISRLDLSDNLIETIPSDAVGLLASAVKDDEKMKINLKGNPFKCDCNLKEFIHFMKKNYKNIENPHDLKCASPTHISGRVLGALVDIELCTPTFAPPTTAIPEPIFPPACPAEHPCWCDYIGNIFCSKGDMLAKNKTFTEVPRIVDMSGFVWEFLHLSGHKIEEVNVLAFFPLRIRRLSLTNNLIRNISGGAFFGTELDLEMVLLEGNRLATVPDALFELPLLTTIDLSLNDIHTVHPKTVMGLHNLIYSDIHGVIDKRDFKAKLGRNAFDCTNCNMWEFAEFVQQNRIHFQDLHLMFCLVLRNKNDTFKRIDDMYADDFPGCTRPTIPPEPTFAPHPDDHCPANYPCWCNYNGITDDILCSANMLEDPKEECTTPPDCPRTPPLTEIPKWRKVTHLIPHATIFLDSNRISTIESKAFEGLKARKIDLSNNSIHYIYSDAFEGLEGDLEELILTMNYLDHVPDALYPMHMMQTLDLSFNMITKYWPANVENMKAWRTKWIHNGTHWDPTDQRKGIQVRLGSNPLTCDKEMCSLRYWVVEEPWDFVDETEIWCVHPTKFFAKKLHEIGLYDLGCDTTPDLKTQLYNALTGKHTMAGLFAFTFLVVLALVGYLVYLTRYKLKASPIPVQFKNPMAARQKGSTDQAVLVDGTSNHDRGNIYHQDTGRMDPPVMKFGDSIGL